MTAPLKSYAVVALDQFMHVLVTMFVWTNETQEVIETASLGDGTSYHKYVTCLASKNDGFRLVLTDATDDSTWSSIFTIEGVYVCMIYEQPFLEYIMRTGEYCVMFCADSQKLALGNFFVQDSPLRRELQKMIDQQDRTPLSEMGINLWKTIERYGGIEVLKKMATCLFDEVILPAAHKHALLS